MMLMIPTQPMQQTQSLTHSHERSPQRMTTSLVIPQAMTPQQTPCSSSASAGRPKLSLNINTTTQSRTFGKGSSLRLETLSAVSPTIVNTFANAYEPPRTPATAFRDLEEAQQTPATAIQVPILQKPARPKLSIDSSVYTAPAPRDSTPDPQDVRTPSSSSVSSASTTNSATIPYQVSHSLHSILANSPILRTDSRKMSGRPRFPAEKKVSFRTPLVEEIRTEKYTLAHSDIESPQSASTLSLSTDSISSEAISESTSTSSESSDPSASLSSSQVESTDSSSNLPSTSSIEVASSSPPRTALRLPHRLNRTRLKTRSPKTGDKRDSSSESDSDTCPETPVAGRRKRRREWVWTLGPLPGATSSEDTTSTEASSSPSTTFSSSIASSTGSDESS